MRHLFIQSMLLLFLFANVNTWAETTNVQVVYSKQEISNKELILTGNITALNDALLASLESGVVNTVKVDIGDHVAKGQVLMTLDSSLAEIELKQAKAALASAQVTYQENLRLYNEITELAKNKVIAKTLLAERKSNVAHSKAMREQTEATVARAQEIVNRHTLIAPFAGTIAQRTVDIGEWVSPQNTVFQLVSDNNLRIFVNIPQQYFNDVAQSSTINTIVSPDAQKKQPLQIPLTAYTPVSDPLSRTFSARIDLPNDQQLISGMSAKVQLLLPYENQSQVSLPKSALKRHPDGSYSVYSVVNNQVKRVAITLLRSGLDNVVVQGIDDNIAVITSGNELLIEGATVSIDKVQGVK